MARVPTKAFSLTFDPRRSDRWPGGYWYAYSETTDAEGVGSDPIAAVAAMALDMEAIFEKKYLDTALKET